MRTDEEVPTAVGTPTSPADPVPMELSRENAGGDVAATPGLTGYVTTWTQVFVLDCPQGLAADQVHLIKDGNSNDYCLALGSAEYAAETALRVAGGTAQSLAEVPTADVTSNVEIEMTAAEESYVKTELPDFDAEAVTLPNVGEGTGGEAASSSSQLPIAGRQEAEIKGNKKPNNRIKFDLQRDEVNPDAMDEGA